MPYSIIKGGGTCKASEWAVIKDSDGKTMGCHTTKDEAEDQVAAIHANEDKKMHSHLARVQLVSLEKQKEIFRLLQQRDNTTQGEDDKLFFWTAEISNDLLDSHFTHMSENTLRNYAADAERGVAFLKGHDWRSLPIGYSLSGKLELEEGRKRVLADFYTVRGLVESDDLIARMEAKLLRDVSVGFYGGQTTCDICGRDVWDWDCRHYPGLTYEEKKDGVVTSVLSTFTIDGANLSEVSGVFDGSTPEAMIRKAESLASGGDLTPQQVRLLENRLRVALPASASFKGVAIPATREKTMDEHELLVQIRRLVNLSEDGDVVAAVEAIQTVSAEAHKRIAVLEPQAAEGQQYRSDLVEAALAEGVRAQGASFAKSLYEEMLRKAPLEMVKQMRDDWKRVADAVLPAGRRSQDEEAPALTPPSLVSDSAFKV